MLGAVRDLASHVATYAGGKSVAATVADEVVTAAEAAIAATRDDGSPNRLPVLAVARVPRGVHHLPARADAGGHASVARPGPVGGLASRGRVARLPHPPGDGLTRTSMRLYNTLTRQKEPFAPAVGNQVRLYACGLTVYARGHIGNFRTFVGLDILRRTLKYVAGHEVRQVVNFTDVDDKTIAGAEREGIPLGPTPSATSRRSTRTAPRSASSRSRKTRAPPTRPTFRRWPT